MASTTTISGLASGIDWQATIDLLMQVERQPVNRLQQRKQSFQQKTTAWNAIQTKLNTLMTQAQRIDTTNEILRKTATSANSDVVSVTAESGAVSGSHSILVNQLAQTEVYVHSDGWADLNTTAVHTGAGGKFVFNFDDETISIDVPNGTTLLGLVQLINNSDNNRDDEGNPLVTASTIDDGGEVDPLHLVLTAQSPTSANSISIDDVETTIGSGGGFDDASWTRTRDAQVAQIRVDGFPPGDWITRESNTISDVLTGVTLTLKDTSNTAVNISVENNYTAIKQRISDWVDAYNGLMNDISGFTRYDAENEVRGVLMDDSQIRNIRSQLASVVINEVPGLSEDAVYRSLGDIGISLGANGTLSINDSKLQAALEADAAGVANVFAKSSSTTDTTLQMASYTKETQGGSYEVEAAWLANGTLDPNGVNTIGGFAATIENKTTLVGKAGTPVEGLRIQFAYPGGGAGSTTATIRFGAGVAVQADSRTKLLTDSFDGLVKSVTDAFKNQISNLDSSIEAYERRLETKREMLVRQFLAMENAVSQASGQSKWLSAMG